ncbi:sensor histidine kinase [Actinocrispum wychmicini]|uniref:Signal transduction histidine kinase n=1 Tax=Actinocrispum wychmicini TaxID=1213861 RepID=A0A4R2JID4_9PSEU|nr:sensor histidine kinase [Actinocrispum wychmicini]TCO58172.1 signal transduction histidine kinase [Actinocrispum wychmicini]
MSHETARFFWLWDCYFAVVYLAVLYLVLVQASQVSAAATYGSAVALTCVVALYVFLGRAYMLEDRHDWRTHAFLVTIMALFAVSVWLTPISAYALFGVIPIVFISSHLFPAVFLVATGMFVPALVSLLDVGPTDDLFRTLVPIGVIGTAFATLIGVWIVRVISQSYERAGLIAKLEASQAEVGRLSHEAGVTAERERLAGEIHDTLAQGFTSIVTLVQAAESELGRDDAQVRKHLDLMLRTARENLAESRALVSALAPADLTESSVLDALERQAHRLTEQTGVAAEFVVQGDRRQLPTRIDVVLLRTLQESLSNIRKHANAATVEIVLSYQDKAVVLLVTDDGTGFDPAGVSDGFGLRGMRSRVDQVGGSLSVTSAPGAGTTIELEVCA